MFDSISFSPNLLFAFTAYLVGVASPGPSNLAIMAAAMNAGRASALALASGVIAGSLIWGLMAAFGLSAVLATWSGALVVLKLLGGLYLLWLAYRAGRSALAPMDLVHGEGHPHEARRFRLFLRGAGMHLTNPKAIFVWLSIVAMALPPGATTRDALSVVGGCACIGATVFGGYAMVFSTSPARRLYRVLRRWFEGALALVFGFAGFRMLLSKGPLA